MTKNEIKGGLGLWLLTCVFCVGALGSTVPAPPTTTTKLVAAKLENGDTVLVQKKKNIVERSYDGARHQMVLHPKITRGAKWTMGGALYVAQVISAVRPH